MGTASAKIRTRSRTTPPTAELHCSGRMMARKGRDKRDAVTVQRKKGPKQSKCLGPVSVVASTRLLAGRRRVSGGRASPSWPIHAQVPHTAPSVVTVSTGTRTVPNFCRLRWRKDVKEPRRQVVRRDGRGRARVEAPPHSWARGKSRPHPNPGPDTGVRQYRRTRKADPVTTLISQTQHALRALATARSDVAPVAFICSMTGSTLAANRSAFALFQTKLIGR